MKLFKVLIDGKSCHGGDMKWSLPKKVKGKWVAGEWQTYEGDVKICEKGLHLTKERFNWYKWGCTAYEAEAKDIVTWENDKCVAKSVRLIKEVPHPKWWTDCEGWIATLKNIAWLKPDGKPKKEWLLFETRVAAGVAAGVAARVAAGVAARAAAGDAAWVAAGVAARAAAWDAAGDAAWVAARAAAGDAARAAAGVAARAAAWDAALYSRGIFICDGLKLAEKHKTHIKKRMEVWKKGYGLLCDVGGKLYCYKRI
jgi:hypothetical protein